jgi:hypothetical protein
MGCGWRSNGRMSGDLNGAIELSRATANHLFDVGGTVWAPVITAVLVEATPATWQRRRLRGSMGGDRSVVRRAS